MQVRLILHAVTGEGILYMLRREAVMNPGNSGVIGRICTG